ncbi:cytosolic carboxypeptidase 1-like [Diaphorina citri]|uniref:Cytosolic carboxypeptidase 1-like n=1 Tax=Diaphorina citri TaxID=121845 RepID=A0A1S3CY17_DIACI|nr:cytosolic carboxypeptidase 1-like [Diaphorina citri]
MDGVVCGNLRKAIQVGTYEYDLLLMPDVNSTHHHQWFYFEISNMDAQASYTLNIVNQEKHHSQYQHGMRPLLFSVKEARCGRALWTRVGTDICYYRNSYVRNPHQRYQGKKTSRAVAKNIREFYYTLSFNIKFKHSLDVCYLAYHYPYTYSYLMRYQGKKTSRAVAKNIREFYYTLSFNIKFKHSLDVCYLAYHYPYTYSYLMISNMDAQASYTLNIVNQEKHHSQYQHGMRPLLFSVKEARCGRALWTRVGTDICYYR